MSWSRQSWSVQSGEPIPASVPNTSTTPNNSLGVYLSYTPDSSSSGAGSRLAALARDALGHRDGRDTPRLRAHDAADAALAGLDRRVQQKLRHLSTHTKTLLMVARFSDKDSVDECSKYC